MSSENEFQDFMTKDEPKPEDIFSMVTILPKKKIKVTAYLEDKDGDRILIADIAENLVKYVNDQLTETETTPVNSQLFPLCGQFMTSLVPRFMGLRSASVLLQAQTFRHALLTLSLSSALFIQYIEQHELKIITEVAPISDDEIEHYLRISSEMDDRLQEALAAAFGGIDDNET